MIHKDVTSQYYTQMKDKEGEFQQKHCENYSVLVSGFSSSQFVWLQLLWKNIYVKTGSQYSLPYFQSRFVSSNRLQLLFIRPLFSENCVGCALFENSVKKQLFKTFPSKEMRRKTYETSSMQYQNWIHIMPCKAQGEIQHTPRIS